MSLCRESRFYHFLKRVRGLYCTLTRPIFIIEVSYRSRKTPEYLWIHLPSLSNTCEWMVGLPQTETSRIWLQSPGQPGTMSQLQHRLGLHPLMRSQVYRTLEARILGLEFLMSLTHLPLRSPRQHLKVIKLSATMMQ